MVVVLNNEEIKEVIKSFVEERFGAIVEDVDIKVVPIPMGVKASCTLETEKMDR